VQQTDVQPDSDAEPDHIAVDETVIQLNDDRHWLYAAVDPDTDEFLYVRLFQTRTTERTMLFLRELRENVPVTQATFLIDAATHLIRALERLSLRCQVRRPGNPNAVEGVFREVKRRPSSVSNTFSHVELPTVESWLETVAVWWNQC
jgi:putative transposase